MTEWTGYTIAAVALVILGIIMLIAGVATMEMNTFATDSWWPWVLIIGGILFLLIGIVVGVMGRNYTPEVTSTHSHTDTVLPGGAVGHSEVHHYHRGYADGQASVMGGPQGYPS